MQHVAGPLLWRETIEKPFATFIGGSFGFGFWVSNPDRQTSWTVNYVHNYFKKRLSEWKHEQIQSYKAHLFAFHLLCLTIRHLKSLKQTDSKLPGTKCCFLFWNSVSQNFLTAQNKAWWSWRTLEHKLDTTSRRRAWKSCYKYDHVKPKDEFNPKIWEFHKLSPSLSHRVTIASVDFVEWESDGASTWMLYPPMLDHLSPNGHRSPVDCLRWCI